MATKVQLVRRLYEADMTQDAEIVGSLLSSIEEDDDAVFTADEILDLIAEDYSW